MSMNQQLCDLLCRAAGIIRRQSVLLTMHGIETDDGQLEKDEFNILSEIREYAGSDENRCVCCGRDHPGRAAGLPGL